MTTSTTLEPGLHLVRGQPKRFFDHDTALRLFEDGWRVRGIKHETSGRFSTTKHLWQLGVERLPDPT